MLYYLVSHRVKKSWSRFVDPVCKEAARRGAETLGFLSYRLKKVSPVGTERRKPEILRGLRPQETVKERRRLTYFICHD